jgi:hypothetical protein
VSQVTSQVTTQVEEVRGTVGSTVDQVRGALPVRTPGLPGLRKPLRRR